jgi:hypothetical protein
MDLVLMRAMFLPNNTRGISHGEQMLGFSLEDFDSERNGTFKKVAGKTAIPLGRYRVVLSHSRRFNMVLPELLDVPHYTGIRIHGGNDENNTEGCPCVADSYDYIRARIYNSNPAVARIIGCIDHKIKTEGSCYIQIIQRPK